MKIMCDRDKLMNAIKYASKAINENSNVITLQGVKLEILKHDELSATGFNLSLEVIRFIDCHVEDDTNGSIVVNPVFVNKILKTMPKGQVWFESNADHRLTISSGKMEYEIVCLDGEMFPEGPYIDDFAHRIWVQKNTLSSMIERTIFATSKNEAKPIMMCELFEFENNKLHVVGVDGFRMSVSEGDAECSVKNTQFVVPATALKEIMANIDKDDNKMLIRVGDKAAAFEFASGMIITRLFTDGEFHRWRLSVPTSFLTEVIVDKKELLQSCKQCQLLLNEKNKGAVKCNFYGRNEMEIGVSTALGKFSNVLNVDRDGKKMEIGFNIKYLTDAVNHIKSDKIKIQMNSPKNSVVIRDEDSKDDNFHIVMPLQLKK